MIPSQHCNSILPQLVSTCHSNPSHPAMGNTVALQCYMYATMECLAIPLNLQHHPANCWHHHFCTLHDHLHNGISAALLIGGPIITYHQCRMPSPSSPTAHNPNACLWWLWWLLLTLEEVVQGWSRRKVGQVWARFEASVTWVPCYLKTVYSPFMCMCLIWWTFKDLT